MAPVLKVLLVDDNESVRLTMGSVLQLMGHVVHVAESLTEARSIQKRAAYDLAILDVHLHDGLGFELIPELRRAHPKAVIAMLSGLVDANSPLAGADMVLEKGQDPELMVKRLELAVAARKKK